MVGFLPIHDIQEMKEVLQEAMDVVEVYTIGKRRRWVKVGATGLCTASIKRADLA